RLPPDGPGRVVRRQEVAAGGGAADRGALPVDRPGCGARRPPDGAGARRPAGCAGGGVDGAAVGGGAGRGAGWGGGRAGTGDAGGGVRRSPFWVRGGG